MAWSRLRRLIAATALAVAATGLAAWPALASPAAAAHPAVAGTHAPAARTAAAGLHSQTVTPAANVCTLYNNEVSFYGSNCTGRNNYYCAAAGYSEWILNNNGNIYSPTYVSNGCAVRVWLYTGSNKTGQNLCVNPHTADSSLHKDYIWIFVSTNRANC